MHWPADRAQGMGGITAAPIVTAAAPCRCIDGVDSCSCGSGDVGVVVYGLGDAGSEVDAAGAKGIAVTITPACPCTGIAAAAAAAAVASVGNNAGAVAVGMLPPRLASAAAAAKAAAAGDAELPPSEVATASEAPRPVAAATAGAAAAAVAAWACSPFSTAARRLLHDCSVAPPKGGWNLISNRTDAAGAAVSYTSGFSREVAVSYHTSPTASDATAASCRSCSSVRFGAWSSVTPCFTAGGVASGMLVMCLQ